MLNCIIIDDEEHAIELLTTYISRTPYLKLVYSTTNPIDGLAYINGNSPDLIFLDIHMDELSGPQVVKMLKDKSKVIFTTAYSNYAIDAFEEGVLDYLLKPISFERFLKATQKATIAEIAQPATASSDKSSIFIKVENKGKMLRIKLEDIIHVEGMRNYIGFHTQSSGLILGLLTFKEVEEALPEPQFVRIHKSHIIAFDRIMGIDGNEVMIKTDKKETKIPIGITYKEKFLSMVNEVGKKNTSNQ
jgi:two-component system, LytTR family, response regulator